MLAGNRRLSGCLSLLLTAWVDGCLQVGVGGSLCCFVARCIILTGIVRAVLLSLRGSLAAVR